MRWLGIFGCLTVSVLLIVQPAQGTDDPRLLPHIRTMSYFTSREIRDQSEAEFIAGHYDIHRGAANFSSTLHSLNPDMWLTWGRNTKAIQDVPDLITWIAGHPEFDLERFFLHYREDVTLTTPSGPLVVPGWRAECSPNCTPAATAPNEAASRVPDLTDPWWTPNPLYPGLLDFYASTIHQRHAQYDSYQGVFWDWTAGAHVHVANQLSKTVEYYGIPDQSTWWHPFIHDSIAVIDLAMARYRELYPSDPPFVYTPANTIAPFWMYDQLGAGTNEYRSNILASSEITHLFFEVWMSFDEHVSPDAGFPSNDIHLKYLKDTITLSQSKKVILQVMPSGDVASDREKLFLLSLEYLVQNPEQFVLAYHLSGEDNPAIPGDTVDNWLWVPALEHNIGLPETNPVGIRDVFGATDTSVFYQWATGSDPGNPGSSYFIYARQYENALVLAKLRQTATATWGESTRTTHQLPRNYRTLQVDGTLGPLITSVSLRNDEGIILVESEDYPPSLALIGNRTIHEQDQLEVTLSATDDDAADTLTFGANSLPSGAALTDHHDRTATFAWTPTSSQSGTYPVTFTVSDGTVTDSEAVTLTVLDGASGCTPAWTCSEWSACAASSQSRTCTDGNACGTDAGRPDSVQACDSTPPGSILDLSAG